MKSPLRRPVMVGKRSDFTEQVSGSASSGEEYEPDARSGEKKV